MINRTQYAVLGALAEGPRTVYTIKKDLEATVGHFWNESYGQLYPVLKQLLDAGWVALLEADGPRNRKLYAITPAGYQALREWLMDPTEYMPPLRNELLLKLFFGRHVPREHSLARLDRYSQQLRVTLATYEAIDQELTAPEAAADENQPFWLATLRNGQFGVKAVLRWCSDARRLLAASPGPARRARPDLDLDARQPDDRSPGDASRPSET